MKNVRIMMYLTLAVLLMTASQGFGGKMYFNDGGTHNIDYTIVDNVYVENHTTVNVLDGGSVSIIEVYDSSQVTMSGGFVNSLAARGSSQVAISGGLGGEMFAFDTSQVTVSGGSLGANLYAYDSSQVTMSGGSVSCLVGRGSSSVTMSGGSVSLNLYAQDSSQITMSRGTIENEIVLSGQANLTITGSNFAIDVIPFSSGEIISILGGSYEYEPYRTLTGTLANGDIINNKFRIGNTAKIVISLVCSEPIPGDLNGDCEVDYEDFSIMASHWLQKSYVRISKFALNTNPDWTTQGQWQFGTPMGMGGLLYGWPDPIVAYTGQNVYGVNLNGDYALGVGGPYTLTAGPFDCNSYAAVKLIFARWLNTDTADYVQCKVEASNDGSAWQTVWLNPTIEPITDYQWQVVQYDISEIAAGHSQVYIQWSYQIISDRAYPYSGWNIDDVELRGLID